MIAGDAKIFSAVKTPNDQTENQEDLYESCEWRKDWLLINAFIKVELYINSSTK